MKNLMKNFVKEYAPYAIESERKTGISSVFILAQAALETGWGNHAPGNMFFGVKADAHTPENQRQLLLTTEVLSTPKARFPQILKITPRSDGKYTYLVKDWFKKYATPEESFTDHAHLFLTVPRYAPALRFKTDPCKFAEAIAKAGYATDPTYAEKLKSVIQRVKYYQQQLLCMGAVFYGLLFASCQTSHKAVLQAQTQVQAEAAAQKFQQEAQKAALAMAQWTLAAQEEMCVEEVKVDTLRPLYCRRTQYRRRQYQQHTDSQLKVATQQKQQNKQLVLQQENYTSLNVKKKERLATRKWWVVGVVVVFFWGYLQNFGKTKGEKEA